MNDSPKLLNLQENDSARLSQALRELLAHGSILGLESGRSELYTWCRQHFDWVKESCDLLGLDAALMREERMIQAVPRVPSLQIRLRQDATLVWLALWYAGDVRWRDEGQTQAFLSVAELNGLLKDQLLPDTTGLLSHTRMEQILRQAARFHLIHFEPSTPFEESGIEVLPAIRRVVPFTDLAAWAEAAETFRKDGESAPDIETDPTEDDEA